MKICAHMNLGPYSNHHARFDTIADAVNTFRNELESFYGTLEGILDRTGEDNAPVVDVYPQCNDCDSHMNFHDYPMARYALGPRGGITKRYV